MKSPKKGADKEEEEAKTEAAVAHFNERLKQLEKVISANL